MLFFVDSCLPSLLGDWDWGLLCLHFGDITLKRIFTWKSFQLMSSLCFSIIPCSTCLLPCHQPPQFLEDSRTWISTFFMVDNFSSHMKDPISILTLQTSNLILSWYSSPFHEFSRAQDFITSTPSLSYSKFIQTPDLCFLQDSQIFYLSTVWPAFSTAYLEPDYLI